MTPGFVGADTVVLHHGGLDLVAVGGDLAAAGEHLRHLGTACAAAAPPTLAAPLERFAAAVGASSRDVGEHVAALGWLGSHLATDLDLATGGLP